MDSRSPRTEVFWREDIRSILQAIDQANVALTAQLPLAQVAIYRAGFAAALQAVALSFDVALDTPAFGTPTNLLPADVLRQECKHE